MPNPNPPIPQKIEDIGLENYLNETKGEHNGADYDEFMKRLDLKEPKTVIARAFNVTPGTIRYWIELHDRKL